MKKSIFMVALFVGVFFSLEALSDILYPTGKCPSGQILQKGGCVQPCRNGQYLAGTVCKACPKNATCDGKNAVCNPGYRDIAKNIHEAICQKIEKCEKNQYLLKGKCTACQKGGVCDGTNMKCTYGSITSNGFITCNTAPGVNPSCVNYVVKNGACADISTMCAKGQIAKADSSGRVICSSPTGTACKTNQYVVSGTCVACPKGATCDGRNPNCPNGYTKDAKGYVTCLTALTCKSGEYQVNNKCKACPKNATCDGKKATCKKGYETTNKSGVITCTKGCPNGYMSSKGCVSECSSKTGVPYYWRDKDRCVTEKECISQGYSVNKSDGSCVKAKVCTTSQYLVGTACKACPKNATCDGKKATCKKGYETTNKSGVITCTKGCPNGYMSSKGCVSECSAKLGVPYYWRDGDRCVSEKECISQGYSVNKSDGSCVKAKVCTTSQYLVGTACKACPKNATCDGKKATCKKGYETTNKSGVITCTVKQCEKGSHTSIEAVKKANKGCTKCRTEDIAAGKCTKNKKAHKHYYCSCDC